ncbi:MAG TPA: ABC transporter permease [Haloplasmataceae bacterium]
MKLSKKYAYPYIVWIIIMIIVPVFLVFYYSITAKDNGFTLDNYAKFFSKNDLLILYKSFKLAFITTVITLLLGYPLAYIISHIRVKYQSMTLLLFIMPMWINMLLRTYAWQVILSRNGVLNGILAFLNLGQLDLLYTETAVIIGMVYNFIPFMVLPIYTSILKVDKSLIDAANDLGANKLKVFIKVILPLTVPGIITGIIMVFLPAVSSFTIPKLLGGGDYLLIGSYIEQQFISTYNWNFGSAISMVIMFFILLSIFVMKYIDKDSKGALPW